jgi:hypothetical protein
MRGALKRNFLSWLVASAMTLSVIVARLAPIVALRAD